MAYVGVGGIVTGIYIMIRATVGYLYMGRWIDRVFAYAIRNHPPDSSVNYDAMNWYRLAYFLKFWDWSERGAVVDMERYNEVVEWEKSQGYK